MPFIDHKTSTEHCFEFQSIIRFWFYYEFAISYCSRKMNGSVCLNFFYICIWEKRSIFKIKNGVIWPLVAMCQQTKQTQSKFISNFMFQKFSNYNVLVHWSAFSPLPFISSISSITEFSLFSLNSLEGVTPSKGVTLSASSGWECKQQKKKVVLSLNVCKHCFADFVSIDGTSNRKLGLGLMNDLLDLGFDIPSSLILSVLSLWSYFTHWSTEHTKMKERLISNNLMNLMRKMCISSVYTLNRFILAYKKSS